MNDIFSAEGITEYGTIPFDESLIINSHLMPKGEINSITVFCVPYRVDKTPEDNYGLSAYARVKDYHGYMKGLFYRILPKLKEKHGCEFYGFSDHSPLNEKLCGAYAGLGVIGKNSLLINKKYGSFVFVGIILSPLKTDRTALPIKGCLNCGSCLSACPSGAVGTENKNEKCLSALTQKKALTDEQLNTIVSAGLCWGCDICQNVCPMNKSALYGSIPYFNENYLKSISAEVIENMSENEYSLYAFSWRKKQVILRNINALENVKKR